MREHPVRLVVSDDLKRTRPRVFFTLLLAIPHFVWIFLWSILMVFAVIVNWLVALTTGRPSAGIHTLTCSYIRYLVHVNAYVYLVADPYPKFSGEAGTYPIDVVLPEPVEQARLQTFFRLFLALPALLLSSALGGGGSFSLTSRSGRSRFYGASARGALAGTCAVLGWFASLVQGRMPKGLRDASAYGLGYTAQSLAYLLLVTDRYPDSDPTAMLDGVGRPPVHVVRLVGDADDLRFTRVTVFFRLILAIPHIVWFALWSVVMIVVAIANWFVTLFTEVPAASLYDFTARYVRYRLHVYAYLMLAANPFPAFNGSPGVYPLDLQLPERGRQDRRKTGFRVILAVPAFLVDSALAYGLLIAAFLTWFIALARGEASWGLRNFSAYALRYSAQTSAYGLLLTDVYPHASPLEGAESPQLTFDSMAAA